MNDRWDDAQDEWDDQGDDLDDELDATSDDWNDDDATETLNCPACGAEIYEDAIRCPECGEYVTQSSHWTAGRPWWWIALGIAGVVAVLGTMLLSIATGWGF